LASRRPELTSRVALETTRNFLTFVNTTAIAYGQGISRSRRFLPICNSSRVYKRRKITSTVQPPVHLFMYDTVQYKGRNLLTGTERDIFGRLPLNNCSIASYWTLCHLHIISTLIAQKHWIIPPALFKLPKPIKLEGVIAQDPSQTPKS